MRESLNKEIRPESKLHAKVLKAVCDRKTYSQSKMSDHRKRWSQVDDEMVVYIPKSGADAARESNREVLGKMDYVTLEVPYIYATVAAAHTYISSTFLARTPIYQVTARHGETQDSVTALEAVLDYQRVQASHVVYHYHWIWDACKYGVGILGEYWDMDYARISRITEREKTILGIRTGKTERVKETIEELAFEGNRLYNIRPFDFFPDPRIPLYDFQRGEFCGRQVQEGLSSLECEQYTGRYINIDVLRETKGEKQRVLDWIRAQGGEGLSPGLEPSDSVVDKPFGVGGYAGLDSEVGKQFVTVLEMAIRIVPKDWELGEGTKPEIWVFTVANEVLVIGARPLGLFHNRFPYSVLETGFGSEEFIKANTPDRIRPLAQTLSWLFNTHMYNVRKAINAVRVVDPSRVVMKDLQKPDPGGIIRLKPQFYGTDARQAIHQLDTVDVTMNHLRDVQVVEQLIQRTSGINDPVMGMVGGGSRRTATEIRTETGFSINRTKTYAEYFSATGFSDLVGRMIANTQQLMSLERKFAIAGSTMMDAQRFVQSSPEAIAGYYDFVPVDGTMPIDRLAQANFWKELLMQLGRVPQLAMGWDLGAMLAHTMSLQGERNVQRFKVNVAAPGMAPGGTLPGNVVPIGGQGGRANPAGSAGGTGSATPTL